MTAFFKKYIIIPSINYYIHEKFNYFRKRLEFTPAADFDWYCNHCCYLPDKTYSLYTAKKHRQQALKNYGIARRNFYFNERLKIMQHYRQRILAGTMPVEAALKDVRILLEANGNDEWTWREEYQKFAEEMETYR